MKMKFNCGKPAPHPYPRIDVINGMNTIRVRNVAAMLRRQGKVSEERTLPNWGRTTIYADGFYIY